MTWRTIIHKAVDEAQTGHRLTEQKVRAQQFSMTAGQQLFLEVICEDPKNTVQVLHSKTEPGLKQPRVKAASFCDQEDLRHFIWLKPVNMLVINSVMEH